MRLTGWNLPAVWPLSLSPITKMLRLFPCTSNRRSLTGTVRKRVLNRFATVRARNTRPRCWKILKTKPWRNSPPTLQDGRTPGNTCTRPNSGIRKRITLRAGRWNRWIRRSRIMWTPRLRYPITRTLPPLPASVLIRYFQT